MRKTQKKNSKGQNKANVVSLSFKRFFCLFVLNIQNTERVGLLKRDRRLSCFSSSFFSELEEEENLVMWLAKICSKLEILLEQAANRSPERCELICEVNYRNYGCAARGTDRS